MYACTYVCVCACVRVRVRVCVLCVCVGTFSSVPEVLFPKSSSRSPPRPRTFFLRHIHVRCASSCPRAFTLTKCTLPQDVSSRGDHQGGLARTGMCSYTHTHTRTHTRTHTHANTHRHTHAHTHTGSTPRSLHLRPSRFHRPAMLRGAREPHTVPGDRAGVAGPAGGGAEVQFLSPTISHASMHACATQIADNS
jgi:hypothetical protein